MAEQLESNITDRNKEIESQKLDQTLGLIANSLGFIMGIIYLIAFLNGSATTETPLFFVCLALLITLPLIVWVIIIKNLRQLSRGILLSTPAPKTHNPKLIVVGGTLLGTSAIFFYLLELISGIQSENSHFIPVIGIAALAITWWHAATYKKL